jgi:hypothetical protein
LPGQASDSDGAHAPLKDDQVRDATIEPFWMVQSVVPDVLELGLERLRAVLADVKVRLERRPCAQVRLVFVIRASVSLAARRTSSSSICIEDVGMVKIFSQVGFAIGAEGGEGLTMP